MKPLAQFNAFTIQTAALGALMAIENAERAGKPIEITDARRHGLATALKGQMEIAKALGEVKQVFNRLDLPF